MTILAAALWMVAVVLLALADSSVLTNLLTFVGLIVVPGAALSLALLPVGRSSLATRVVGSVGFGLAFAILAAIVLDRLPIGLRWIPLFLAIAAVLSVAILAGVGRRAGPIRIAPVVASVSSRQMALFGLSAVLAVGAFGIARIGASATAPVDVTQLWILPDAGGAVEIGVANLGDVSQEYRLVLNLDGRDIKEWPTIQLQPGQVWKGAPDAVIPKGLLRAALYRSDLPGRAFREVSIALPAAAS